jgi:AcrR family transcriptional regulator
VTAASDARADAGGGRTRLPRSARRAQLLAAAQEVFVASGYHAAAMDDIAERAGVSKPVLYQHFPGKLELYLALLDQAAEGLVHAVERALASTADNKARAAATTDAYFRFVDETAGSFRLVFESDLVNEAAVRERTELVTHRCAEAISALIAEDAGLSREESMLLAVALVGMQQTAARWWLAQDGPVEIEDAVRLVSTLAWRGVRGFPRTGEGAAPA